MEENKFKSVLQDKVNNDKKQAEINQELREEYGIRDGRMVGIKIHKDRCIITLWKILKDVLQLVTKIITFGFAFIGFLAVLHPSMRDILLVIWKDSLEQVKTFAPFLPI